MEALLLSLVIAPVAAFMLGAFDLKPWHFRAFAFLLIVPFLIYTVLMARAGSAEHGMFIGYWLLGLLMGERFWVPSYLASFSMYHIGKRFRRGGRANGS